LDLIDIATPRRIIRQSYCWTRIFRESRTNKRKRKPSYWPFSYVSFNGSQTVKIDNTPVNMRKSANVKSLQPRQTRHEKQDKKARNLTL